MATTTDLGNVNIFSSLASFNSNKANLKSNDLNFIKQTAAEMAVVGGGIVAQLLAENGYVKFANGLILQWGSYTSNVQYTFVTFPISTSVTYSVVAVARTTNQIGCSGSQSCQYVSNVSASGFGAGSYDTKNGYAGFWWVAICKA